MTDSSSVILSRSEESSRVRFQVERVRFVKMSHYQIFNGRRQMFNAGRTIFFDRSRRCISVGTANTSGKDQDRCSRIEFELSLRVYGRGTKLLSGTKVWKMKPSSSGDLRELRLS